jgi:glycosyltransferase involved in cell wall biosynthesis
MRAIYVSTLPEEYSRSGVYLSADPGEKLFWKFPLTLRKQICEIILIKSNFDRESNCIVMMSPNHLLVLLFRKLTSFKIILDAGWPLSDSSREPGKSLPTAQRVQNSIIDYLSFRNSDIVIFESAAQLESAQRKFKIHEGKLRCVYTGFNEFLFEKEMEPPQRPNEFDLTSIEAGKFIFFRGKVNPESGLDLIIETALLMQNDACFVICTDRLILNPPPNVLVISRYVRRTELKWLYQNSSCVLGQMSNHTRLDKTIPHKFFESAYFSKCYVSPLNVGLSELIDESSIISVEPINAESLRGILSNVISDENLRRKHGSNLNKVYKSMVSQKELGIQFRQIIESLD